MRALPPRRSGFLATLAVGVGLLASSFYGLAQVGQDLELAAARSPAPAVVAERDAFPVADRDCPHRGEGESAGSRL